MGWASLLENPQQILAYYDASPKLSEFELVEFRYDREGPTVYIRGNLSESAVTPSSRWIDGSNTVQITFQLVGLSEFAARGVATGVRGTLKLEASSSGIAFAFDAFEGLNITGIATAIYCPLVHGYIEERRIIN